MKEKKEDYSRDRYKVWLEQSSIDLQAGKVSFDNLYFEWACYQSIQSIEKAVKAVIVHAGWRPPKVHKLGVLLGIANRANKLFEKVDLNYRKIEAYTFVSRYPFIIPGQNRSPHDFITKEDAETCLDIAEDVYRKIDDFIKQGRVEKQDFEMDDQVYYFEEHEILGRIESIVETLISSDKLDIQRIMLYGSFAREVTRPRTTTMDLLIIANTDLPFIERIKYVREKTKGQEPIVEPLIYSPEEFEYLIEHESEGYLESALEESKILFEK